MPTEMVAQNGAVIKQSTKVKVTGCAKPKPKKKTKEGAQSGQGGTQRAEER